MLHKSVFMWRLDAIPCQPFRAPAAWQWYATKPSPIWTQTIPTLFVYLFFSVSSCTTTTAAATYPTHIAILFKPLGYCAPRDFRKLYGPTIPFHSYFGRSVSPQVIFYLFWPYVFLTSLLLSSSPLSTSFSLLLLFFYLFIFSTLFKSAIIAWLVHTGKLFYSCFIDFKQFSRSHFSGGLTPEKIHLIFIYIFFNLIRTSESFFNLFFNLPAPG